MACQLNKVMNAKFLLAAPFAVAFTACDPSGATLDTSGIDPLRPPAGNVDTTDYGTALKPGEFVTAAINNTAFYKAKPKEDQEADKLLSQGTPMKIISLSGSYTKVELDSGEVGFVPTVMLSTGEDELSPIEGAPDTPIPIINLDSEIPLPVLDPSTAPPVESGETPPVESGTLPPVVPVPPNPTPEKPIAE